LGAVQEALEWLDEFGGVANVGDFEEQKEQLSNAAHPITSELYDGAEDGESWGEHGEL